MQRSMPVALTIAGSDSGGGAGIQADLKTFSALGVFGTSALTAITAQNSVGVRRVDLLPVEGVVAQIDAVAEDMAVAAVKVGMLGSRELVVAVAQAIARHAFEHVVVDPVMVASSGDPLLEPGAIDAVREQLLPRCTLLTPNMPEAALLLGREMGHGDAEFEGAGRDLLRMGAPAVLLKAGHREGDADDVLLDAEGVHVLRAERIPTASKHGTGCTLSAAIAAALARGHGMRESVAMGKEYVTRAITEGFRVGQGQGVLHHFWEYYGPEGLP